MEQSEQIPVNKENEQKPEIEEQVINKKDTIITVHDERGAGHANHRYGIYNKRDGELLQRIKFQEGPIQEAGVNGIQNEDLLEIVIDRLIGFQTGEFYCEENEEALLHIKLALIHLELRTAKRRARDVEGKNIS